MKRIGSVLLVMVLCVALLVPLTASGAGDEYISSNKSTFVYGEYMEVVYKFAEADPTRWVCVYKGSDAVSNMVFTYPATSTVISGYYMPWLGVALNGHQVSDAFEPGNYIMKVMHIPEGGNYMDANNFSTGADSNITYSFTVTANSATTPAISIADREIEKNGTLMVSYSGISYMVGNRALNLVVTNQNGQTIKSRSLLTMNQYAGISGEIAIAMTGVEPGTYKVGFACEDSAYTISQAPIEITVVDQAVGDNTAVFPADVFKDKETCSRYFANADKQGVTYEVIDGEYVMNVPHHMGFDYIYTWEPIPYDTYTVSYDFLLHIVEDFDSYISDEMDFLFGMSEDTTTHHQLSVSNSSGAMSVSHWTRTKDTPYVNYVDDGCFYDLYEDEAWHNITIQFTKDEVVVFLNGEEIVALSESAGCTGALGRFAFRGGSSGGWAIKNLKVSEGLYTDEPITNPTETPTEVPTEVPAETDSQDPGTSTPAPTQKPTEQPKDDNGGSSAWIIIVIVAVVVVACGVVTILVLKKKK